MTTTQFIEQPWSIPFVLPILYWLLKREGLHWKPIYSWILFTWMIPCIYFLLFPIHQKDDFDWISQAAAQLSQGDLSFTRQPYFVYWNHQIGIVFWYAIWFLFLPSKWAIVFANLLAILGSAFAIYSITRKYSDPNTGLKAATIWMLLPLVWIRLGIAGNDLIFLSCSLFAIRFFIAPRFAITLLGTIPLTIAQLLRPEGLLIWIGLFLLVSFMQIAWQRFLTWILLYIPILFFSQHIPLIWGIPYPISINDSLWKFVIGLNIPTNGTYDEALCPMIGQTQIELNYILAQFQNPLQLLIALVKKFSLFWGRWDSAIQFTDLPKAMIIPYAICEKIIFLYLFIKIFQSSHRQIHKGLLLFMAIYISIYSVIEMAPRYKISLWPFMIIIYAIISRHLKSSQDNVNPVIGDISAYRQSF